MPHPAPAPCLHELRPGTKVCLHCRRAEREARTARRNQTLARVAVGAIALGVATATVRAGIDAFERGSLPQIPLLMAATTKIITESLPGAPAMTVPPVAPVAETTAPVPQHPDSGVAIAAITDSAAPTTPLAPGPMAIETVSLVAQPPASAPAVTDLAPAPTPAPPVITAGRQELEGGLYAMRSGDTITVYFDTPDARTRRPEKFEQIVRATLPVIHGAPAELILAGIAPGALIGAVDLLNDLPTRGLHFRAADGRTLSLWPETRPGRDGPLVVAYRSVLPR
jgi:hypothetical protein